MGVKVTNNAFGTLSAGISTSDTTITLDSGQGARFPTLSSGDYFFGTIVDTSNNLEIVKVTARSSDSMTVVRGQDDTTATAFAIGDRFELRPTAALFNDIIDNAAVDGVDSSATDTVISIDSSNDITIQNGASADSAVNMVLKSTEDVTLTLFADSDNVTESHNPQLVFKQDGNVQHLIMGVAGANNDPVTGVVSNGSYLNATSGGSTRSLSLGSNGNTGVFINADNHVTKPNQPVFCAYRSSSYALGSGDIEVNFDATLVNQGSHFATSGNRFTCPCDGIYKFDFHISCYRDDTTVMNSQDDSMYMTVKKNGTELGRNAGAPATMLNPGVNSRNGVELASSFSVILSLSENDYIEPEFGDISVSLTISNAMFTGFLLA